MDNQQIARAILNAVGPDNITEAYNCMTRLRLRVKDATVTKEELKKIPGVKGVIFNDGEIHIVLGPGKAENVTKECKRLLAEKGNSETVIIQQTKNKIGDGKELHAEIKKRNSESAFKRLLLRIGHIFVPLIPAFIGFVLLTGLVTLLLKISPDMAGNT